MADSKTSGVLERRLKSRPIADGARRALINLQIAYAYFEEDFATVTAHEGLSSSAFNVLRILRGQPDGHPRSAIAERLVYRGTDVTRLIDGLEKRGLVERVRSKQDRRLSLTRLTQKGTKALTRLDPLVDALVDRYRTRLKPAEISELNRLLEALYADRLA